MLRELYEDALEMATVAMGNANRSAALRTVVLDSFSVMALQRAREFARRFHVPLANRVLRLVQMGVYGIEVGKDVTLGKGVYFVHTMGTVIGGDAKVGDRVRIMSNVTIGTAKDNGYPVIEDDVSIGTGARILGPVRIGKGATIGANAVVLNDVPAGAVAVGVPAVVRTK